MSPEALVADALRTYLFRKLPAEVTALNVLRRPELITNDGPWDVTGGGTLSISTGGAAVPVTLPSDASMTATELAALIEAAIPGIAFVEGAGVRLRGSTPTTTAPGILSVAAGAVNATLGWDAGGIVRQSSPLRAPKLNAILDGWGNAPATWGSGSFIVMLGDRQATPMEGSRREEWFVSLEIAVFVPVAANQASYTRESVTSALEAVRNVLLTTEGRQLGKTDGSILFLRDVSSTVAAEPMSIGRDKTPSELMDVATLGIEVRVYREGL